MQVASTPTFEHLLALSDRVELPVFVDALERVHPAGVNVTPAPATMSLLVADTRTSSAPAAAMMRAATCTADATDAVSADFDLTEVYPGGDS